MEPLSVILPADPECVSTARAWVREHCVAACGPSVCEDMALVVSELFGNAVLHGRGPVELSLV